MFEHLTVGGWEIAALCGLLVGIAKTGVPGVAILAVPLLAIIFPPRESSGIMLPMLLLGDLLAVSYYRRQAVWRHLLPLFPYTLAGIVAGYFALGRLSNAQMGPLIGGIVLALLAMGLRKRRDDDNQVFSYGQGVSFFYGFLAGFTTMIANAAGPVMALYLLSMRLPKEEFLGTGAWFFLLVNWAKVPFSVHLGLITRESLTFNLHLAPFVIAGTAAGVWTQKRMRQKTFDLCVQFLAAIAAVRLLLF